MKAFTRKSRFEAWQRFSCVVTPRAIDTWVGDELEAQPKEGAKIGRWFLHSGKVVKCQVGGPVELASNCHFGKVDRGVVAGRFGEIGDEAEGVSNVSVDRS